MAQKSDPVQAVNAPLEEEAKALFGALSPLGRRLYFPPDIPFQAGEARGKGLNATVGQIRTTPNGKVANARPPQTTAIIM